MPKNTILHYLEGHHAQEHHPALLRAPSCPRTPSCTTFAAHSKKIIFFHVKNAVQYMPMHKYYFLVLLDPLVLVPCGDLARIFFPFLDFFAQKLTRF